MSISTYFRSNIHQNGPEILGVKNAHAMWKVLMVYRCDNDILEGLAVADPLETLHPLFLS
jgi:hypothetical protein